MRIVNGECLHSEKTVQNTRKLMPMNQAKLSQPERKIAIRALRVSVNKRASGTIHRFNRILGFTKLRKIHMIFIMGVMAALLPKLIAQNHGRANFFITFLFMLRAPITNQFIVNNHAPRMEKWNGGGLVMKTK